MTQVLTNGDDNVSAADATVYALDGIDRIFTSISGPNLYGGEGSDFLGNNGTGIGDLYGGAGNDGMHGGTSLDRLYGDRGDDLLVGGEFNYASAAGGSIVVYNNEVSGNDYLDGGLGVDAIYGFDGNDQIYGGEGNDSNTQITVTGDSGSYNIIAGLYGNAGDDVIDGGSGNDLLDGGTGIDTLIGGLGDDILAGGDDADSLDGGDGADTLNGGAGSDTMRGGAGNDTYFVDDALDIVREAVGDGSDTVQASTTFALLSGAEVEFLTTIDPAGTTAIDLTGNAFAQTITGNAGNNVLRGLEGDDNLSGGAGKDRLLGGLGKDFLTGGEGSDQFVFNSAPNKSTNVDFIVDFNRPADTLQLDNAFLTKVGANGALKAAAFYLGKTAHDASDRIIYDKATGNLFYDADGQGGSAQIKIALLLNKATVGLNDFVVI